MAFVYSYISFRPDTGAAYEKTITFDTLETMEAYMADLDNIKMENRSTAGFARRVNYDDENKTLLRRLRKWVKNVIAFAIDVVRKYLLKLKIRQWISISQQPWVTSGV